MSDKVCLSMKSRINGGRGGKSRVVHNYNDVSFDVDCTESDSSWFSPWQRYATKQVFICCRFFPTNSHLTHVFCFSKVPFLIFNYAKQISHASSKIMKVGHRTWHTYVWQPGMECVFYVMWRMKIDSFTLGKKPEVRIFRLPWSWKSVGITNYCWPT